MAIKAQRVLLLILLVCFGFLLLLQPVKGSSLRSINSLLRWKKENHVAVSSVAQMPATSAEKKKKPLTKNKRIGANHSTDDTEKKQKVDPCSIKCFRIGLISHLLKKMHALNKRD